jgi:uncharacterized membrane protein
MFVSWNWFWYVLVGILLGGGGVFLGFILKDKKIRFKWYEWILVVLGFLLFLFLGQTFIGSFNEGENRAAWMSLLFIGLPIVLIGVGTFRLVQSRTRKSH